MFRVVVAFLGLALLTPDSARGGVIEVANPKGTDDIGARIRWGGSGFEASLYDSKPFSQSPTLNPSGSPVWQVGLAYAFQLTFNPGTGTLSLSIDFNRNNSFESVETISDNTYSAPGQTNYTGFGFGYLQINGNESGSAARAVLSDLMINGTAVNDLAPNGGFVSTYYTDGNTGLLASLNLTGNITFNTSGTAQERPAFNFVLANAGIPTPIPEPATLALFALVTGAGASIAYRRRKTA